MIDCEPGIGPDDPSVDPTAGITFNPLALDDFTSGGRARFP
jgi:hypothetical protein